MYIMVKKYQKILNVQFVEQIEVNLKKGDIFYILDEQYPNYVYDGYKDGHIVLHPIDLKSLKIRKGDTGIYYFYPDDSDEAKLLTTLDLRDIYDKMGQIEQAIIDVNEAISNYSGGE